ncbi:MAG: cation:proton antiporter [Gammaproteobacteria bacterium]|nr:cation:proton antiporter [Gammaproteobacteria bacterium]MDH3465295.1 cation:proton antiporter [Gammaproteobacteria bacterium]
MSEQSIVFYIFVIFTGAAVLATLALYARQALPVAYIVLGGLLGPWGIALVDDAALIEDIAHVGIIFLLFLLGLDLYPQKLIQLLRQTTIVTVASAVVFAVLGYSVATAFGLGTTAGVVIGVATMFSSTIIGIKLLPTTVLHHRHTGEVVISVLLLQDVVAIVVLLVLHGVGRGDATMGDVALLLAALPVMVLLGIGIERYVLFPLFRRFDRIQEYVFLLTLGWCLGMAQIAEWIGLSYEIGAFIAGVAVAANPIARHIADSLKPLRDFFLVMFFFALGAGFNINEAQNIWLPAATLALLVLLVKPVVFRFLLVSVAETKKLAWEIGVRLGQLSEFSLLISFLALESGLMTAQAAYCVQLATILTFIGSSYLIVLRYPTPIAVSDSLRRD